MRVIMIRINMRQHEVVAERKVKKRGQSDVIMMMMMRMMRVKRMKKRLRNRLKRKREGSRREAEVQRKDLQKRRVSLLEMMAMVDKKGEVDQDQNQREDQRKRLVIRVMIALINLLFSSLILIVCNLYK